MHRQKLISEATGVATAPGKGKTVETGGRSVAAMGGEQNEDGPRAEGWSAGKMLRGTQQ